ncbi:MAG TPA: hypothetical protein DCY13_00755, partial [Verrucomicrobiales bacterium]|nr:hypothetical protein [Verrucomicrobiales bacterium]
EPGLDARVELEGRPAWSHGLLSGRAGHLVWESITNRYRLAGTDGAHLRFPQSMLTTNQAGTNLLWIDLTAGHHEFVPGR